MRVCLKIATAATVLLGLAAPAAAAGPELSPLLTAAAASLRLEMTPAEAALALRGLGLEVSAPRRLPGGGEVMLATPRDGDCLPQLTPLRCPQLRLLIGRGPEGARRIGRVDGFDLPARPATVAEVMARAEGEFGPPLRSTAAPEETRGAAPVVWRQSWIQAGGVVLDIMATSLDPEAGGPALGLGFSLADPQVAPRAVAAR